MTTRRFTNISVFFLSLIAVLFFVLSAHSATLNPAVVTREEVANLTETIEHLNEEIKLLEKKIQVLSDFLYDLNNALNKVSTPPESPQDSPATKAVASVASSSKLRSPRQIDRTPVREEKTDLLVTRLKVSTVNEETVDTLVKLLTTKNGSNFVQSLKTQLTQWLETPSTDRAFDSPFSPKQFAWVQFLMYPGEYENPKRNKDLYPNG